MAGSGTGGDGEGNNGWKCCDVKGVCGTCEPTGGVAVCNPGYTAKSCTV